MEQLRIALWQGPSIECDIEAGMATLAAALRAAAAMGAQTLVAPELYLPGYNQDALVTLAQPRGGPWHQRLGALAAEAGCGLVLGYAERDGVLYNSAVAFDAKGQEIAHYRKIQLFGPREQRLFAFGEAYEVFDFHGIKAALLICYDVEFDHHIRALKALGVGLILCPTACPKPFENVATAVVPAHAANHTLSIVYANYCGEEGDCAYFGLSLITGPHGQVMAQAGAGPALLIAEIPPPEPARLTTQARDLRIIR
jgi:predicted amidohydrolase